MGKSLIIISLVLIFLVVTVVFSPRILAKTDTPEFCASCHVMQEQYITLIKGGVHNSLKCVDCHLPNDSKVSFYFWKAVDGSKDLIAFHTGRVSDPIKTSAHSKKIIQQNCIRCHDSMVSRITIADRKCWDCHQRTSHRQRGLRETI